MNAGFDTSLSSFYMEWSSSKQACKQFFLRQLPYNYGILIGLIVLFYKYFNLLEQATSQDIILFTTIVITILLESTRKTLKTLMYITHQNSVCTTAEVLLILGYTTIIWFMYFCGVAINLYIIVIPLATMSFFTSCYLLYTFFHWYKKLPTPQNQSYMHSSRIVKTRFFTYIYELINLLFSSNALIPFLALYFGLKCAGLLKLATIITTVLQKIFGQASNALLAYLKHKPHLKRNYFFSITTHFNQILYGIIIFIIINNNTLFNACSIHEATVIIPCFLIIFTGNFIIPYEKLYITEEKALYLAAVNTIVAFFILLSFNWIDFSSHVLLYFIAVIRILSYIVLLIFSYYIWNIKPTIYIKPRYAFASLIISFLFFFIHN